MPRCDGRKEGYCMLTKTCRAGHGRGQRFSGWYLANGSFRRSYPPWCLLGSSDTYCYLSISVYVCVRLSSSPFLYFTSNDHSQSVHGLRALVKLRKRLYINSQKRSHPSSDALARYLTRSSVTYSLVPIVLVVCPTIRWKENTPEGMSKCATACDMGCGSQ